jgi:predicted O-linked N-acetylglucosamine transferase (SPINDLY family)
MALQRPNSHAGLARHAGALIQAGQTKAAERILKDILRADATQFDALLLLGVLSGMRDHTADAVKLLSRAVRRRPDSEEALYNLGQALIRMGRFEEAAGALQNAVALAPLPQAHEKLGDCLRHLGRLPDAIVHYARAVELAGEGAGALLLSSLVETKRRICDWSGLDAIEQRLRQRVEAGDVAEPLLLLYLFDDARLHHDNAVAYAQRLLAPTLAQSPRTRRFEHKPRDRDRLRIGYLCSDFRNHATSHLVADLIESHDRTRFEIVGLSFGPDDKSAMRQRMVTAFDRFVDLRTRTSEEIARQIHALGIDILVDLNGYIANARPQILAARSAPIQCHYLAYPGTLGGSDIDYMIVDRVIVPPGEDARFTEALVRLPDCYQANDRRRVVADMPTRAYRGLSEGAFVFASFNNAIKLSPMMFDVWMRILTAVPGSVLWLFAEDQATSDNLRREAAARGVEATRLAFAQYAPPAEHLARLRLADLFLDTQPYTAHTTASDALWVGLPVLTIEGSAFAGRVGASIVKAAGLPELIMPSRETYEREAIALARDPERVARLKAKVAAGRGACRLFDTPRFARHLEAAYREMWARWQRGEPPSGFDVARID